MCYINIFENEIYIIFHFKDVDTHYEFKISCLIYYLILINIILILYFNKFRIVKNKSETNVIEKFAYFLQFFNFYIPRKCRTLPILLSRSSDAYLVLKNWQVVKFRIYASRLKNHLKILSK